MRLCKGFTLSVRHFCSLLLLLLSNRKANTAAVTIRLTYGVIESHQPIHAHYSKLNYHVSVIGSLESSFFANDCAFSEFIVIFMPCSEDLISFLSRKIPVFEIYAIAVKGRMCSWLLAADVFLLLFM